MRVLKCASLHLWQMCLNQEVTSFFSPSSHCNQFHREWSGQSHFQLFLQESLTCSQEHLQCQNSQGCSTWWWITLMSTPDPTTQIFFASLLRAIVPWFMPFCCTTTENGFTKLPLPSYQRLLYFFLLAHLTVSAPATSLCCSKKSSLAPAPDIKNLTSPGVMLQMSDGGSSNTNHS